MLSGIGSMANTRQVDSSGVVPFFLDELAMGRAWIKASSHKILGVNPEQSEVVSYDESWSHQIGYSYLQALQIGSLSSQTLAMFHTGNMAY